jgi:hypothetical protein
MFASCHVKSAHISIRAVAIDKDWNASRISSAPSKPCITRGNRRDLICIMTADYTAKT